MGYGPQTQTQSGYSRPDPFAMKSTTAMYNSAADWMNQNQPTVAGFQPYQQAAQDMLGQNLLGYTPGFNQPQVSPWNAPMLSYDPNAYKQQSGKVGATGGTMGPGGYNPHTGAAWTGRHAAPTGMQPGTGPSGQGATDVNQLPQQQAYSSPMPQGYNFMSQPAAQPGGPQPGFQPIGMGEVQTAADVAGGIAQGYQPGQVTTQFNTPTTGVAGAATPGDISAQQIQPQTFGNSQGMLSQLMNPFTDLVTTQALSDLDRGRRMALTQGPGSSSAAAYGGDRTAIREAETNRNFADAAARTSAQLRSEGFGQAANLLGQDIRTNLQAGMANQGAGLQAGMSNQAMQGGMNRFNAGLGQQAMLANQGAQLQTMGMGQRGEMANQQAGLAGTGMQLGAAGDLAGYGGQMFGQTLGGANALNQIGNQQQQLAQQYYDSPMQNMGLLQSILQGIPMGMNHYSRYQQPGGSLASGIMGAGLGLGGAALGSPWLGGALGF